MVRFFATCARGLEPILADELRELGAEDIAPGRGGTAFAGDKALLYRANLWLRTAIRVLQPILEADVTSPDELYEAVKGLDWSQYLTPDHTLAVDLQCPRFAPHALQVCRPAGQRCHLRSVHRARRPPAQRGCRRADGRAQSPCLPRSCGAESRKLRRFAAQARLSAGADPGTAQRSPGSGHRPVDGMARRSTVGRSDVWLGSPAHRSGLAGAASTAWTDTPPFRISGMDGLRRASVEPSLRDEALGRGKSATNCRRPSWGPMCGVMPSLSPPVTPARPVSVICCISRSRTWPTFTRPTDRRE